MTHRSLLRFAVITAALGALAACSNSHATIPVAGSSSFSATTGPMPQASYSFTITNQTVDELHVHVWSETCMHQTPNVHEIAADTSWTGEIATDQINKGCWDFFKEAKMALIFTTWIEKGGEHYETGLNISVWKKLAFQDWTVGTDRHRGIVVVEKREGDALDVVIKKSR